MSVPFPATRDLRSLVAGNGTSWEDKNHFIFLTPVSINKYSFLNFCQKCFPAQWFGMSHFRQNCTWDFGPFLCFLANYKSWAAHIICLFHVEFDLWYSMVCSKLRYFWLYYMNLLVNGVCLISFFVPLCPAWYFQGVIFSYIGTFFVYYTLMWSLMQGMLILY